MSWHWRVMQSLKKNWLLVPKMTWGIWWILMQAVTSLKICSLMCYFCRKYIMFEPKDYRGVMCHNTEEWCKIWRGTDLYFEKWHEEFCKFWPNSRKTQNLDFNGLILTKVYNVWAKKVQRSYASLYWRSMQTLMEKWLKNLKICTLRDFLSNAYNVELNNYRGNIRNLVNFHENSRMSEIFVNSI